MVTTVVIDSYTSYSVVVPRSAVLFVEIRVLAFYFDIYYIYINTYIYDWYVLYIYIYKYI